MVRVRAVLVYCAVPRLAGGWVVDWIFLVLIVKAVFVGENDDVLVAVEIVHVVALVGEGEEEVLQLGEGEQDWRLDNLYAKPVKGGVVEDKVFAARVSKGRRAVLWRRLVVLRSLAGASVVEAGWS